MDILEKVLSILHVTKPARAVYIDLVEHGASSARQVSVRLSMTRPSVYDQLKILMQQGLIVERDLEGKTIFAIHDISHLGRLLEVEQSKMTALAKDFTVAQKQLLHKTESVEPKIKFIAGKEGILIAMHDMLWDETLLLKAVWPYHEMMRALGRDALAEFNKKRIRNGLRLQTIWPGGKDPGNEYIWKDGDALVERRVAPKVFHPRMGYTVYGDKVLFISSASEAFGFVVQSRDFAHLMTEQFDVLWSVSK